VTTADDYARLGQMLLNDGARIMSAGGMPQVQKIGQKAVRETLGY